MAVKELPWEQGCCVDLRLPALAGCLLYEASLNAILFSYTRKRYTRCTFSYLENNPSTVTAA